MWKNRKFALRVCKSIEFVCITYVFFLVAWCKSYQSYLYHVMATMHAYLYTHTHTHDDYKMTVFLYLLLLGKLKNIGTSNLPREIVLVQKT